MSQPPKARLRMRVVQPDTVTSVDMAEAANALLQKSLAEEPDVIMIVWERGSSSQNHSFSFASVPDAASLQCGMADRLFAILHPELME